MEVLWVAWRIWQTKNWQVWWWIKAKIRSWCLTMHLLPTKILVFLSTTHLKFQWNLIHPLISFLINLFRETTQWEILTIISKVNIKLMIQRFLKQLKIQDQNRIKKMVYLWSKTNKKTINHKLYSSIRKFHSHHLSISRL